MSILVITEKKNLPFIYNEYTRHSHLSYEKIFSKNIASEIFRAIEGRKIPSERMQTKLEGKRIRASF